MIQFDTIKKVEQHLRKAGVRNKDLLEEMCDHFLTEIEIQVANGADLAKAEKKVLAQIQQKNYRPMNQHILFIHHKNQIIMSNAKPLKVSISENYGDSANKEQLNKVVAKLQEIVKSGPTAGIHAQFSLG